MMVTRFAWIAQRFLGKFRQVLCGLTRFLREGFVGGNLRVFEQVNKISFRRLLKSEDGRTLPP